MDGIDDTTMAVFSLFVALVMTGAYVRFRYGPLEPRMRAWAEARFGEGAWRRFYVGAVVLTVVVWGAIFLATDPQDRGGTDQVIERFKGGDG